MMETIFWHPQFQKERKKKKVQTSVTLTMISSYRKWMVEFLQKLRNRLHDACDAFPWGFVWFGDLQLQN